MIGLNKAEEMHRRYGTFEYPVDVEGVANREGLTIIDWPLLPPIDEVKLGHSIGLREGLPGEYRRWNIAHALGHHVLHHGNQLLAPSSRQTEARAGD